MLRDLIATIKTLRGRIRDYRPYFDAGRPEAKTRVSLIDPLLRALEWDVGNPGLVEIEPVVAQGRADYAFMRGVGEPLLLLEAKRLSDTQAHHGQLATYVVGENLCRGGGMLRECRRSAARRDAIPKGIVGRRNWHSIGR